MKRSCTALLVLLLAGLLILPVFAQTAPVFADDTGTLDAAAAAEALTRAARDGDFTVAAAVTGNAGGDVQAAAESWFDLTYGPNTRGILLYLDVNAREYRILVRDDPEAETFNPKALRYVQKAVEARLRQNDFQGGVEAFAEKVGELLDLKAQGKVYGKGLSLLWIPGALLGGFLLGGLPVGGMKRENRSVRKQQSAVDYLVPGSVILSRSTQQFVHRKQDRRPVSQNNTSVTKAGSNQQTSVGGKF